MPFYLSADTYSVNDKLYFGIGGGIISPNDVEIKTTTALTANNVAFSANIDGEFEFLNVPEGYYTLNVSYIGYESIVYPDVWVRPKAYDRLEISMNQLVIEFDRVLVEDSYFKNSGLNQDQSITFRMTRFEEPQVQDKSFLE